MTVLHLFYVLQCTAPAAGAWCHVETKILLFIHHSLSLIDVPPAETLIAEQAARHEAWQQQQGEIQAEQLRNLQRMAQIADREYA